MIIYFLRHAEAEDCADSDFKRRLTPKGLEQAEKVGKFCVRYGLIPEVILTSPVVRAKQTAESVGKLLGNPTSAAESWLACGMSASACLGELRAYEKLSHVMLVGHEPDFSEAIAVMIGLPDSDHLHIRKASLTAVSLRAFQPGNGQIEFSVPVRLM
jgi:phosphohistidine phosphatase